VSLAAEGIKPESVSVRPIFDRLSPFIERPRLRGAWGSDLIPDRQPLQSIA
jgi:hypothetical protein